MRRKGSMSRILPAAVAALALSVAASVGVAADPAPPSAKPPAAAAPSKETRESMAALHEQMAACLRSDKSIEDCRSEMRKACHEKLGDHDCPMMSMHGHDRMRMRPHSTDQK